MNSDASIGYAAQTLATSAAAVGRQKNLEPCHLNTTYWGDCVTIPPLGDPKTMTPDPDETWFNTEMLQLINDITYYALPVIFASGIVFAIANVILVLSRLYLNSDLYLLALTVAETLLLVSGALLKFPYYLGHNNDYQYYIGPLLSLNAWFWYASTWILLVTVFDQVIARSNKNRTYSSGSHVQAACIGLLVFAVCLVSALPQFWAYEVAVSKESTPNNTILILQKTKAMDTREYTVMYFWYQQTITLILPYPVMLIMLLPLWARVARLEQTVRNGSRSQGGYAAFRQAKLELSTFKLCLVLSILYLLLTSAYTIHTFLAKLDTSLHTNRIHVALNNIFLMLFYSNYALHFIVFSLLFDKHRSHIMDGCCPLSSCCRSSKEPPETPV